MVILWAVDFWRLPRAKDLEVRRIWRAPVSLGSRTTVEVEVHCDTGVPVLVEVIDDVPASLRAAPATFSLRVAPGYPGRWSYIVEPLQRGDLRIGRIYLRVQSRLRLAERWSTAEAPQTVRVYPNLEDARRQTMYLIRSHQVELEKRLKRRRSRGREFESLREYRQGDEMREICWTASARRGNLVTKVQQIERSQAVWIVIDAGRLLRAKLQLEGWRGPLEKLDAAVNAALTLAHVALYSGDRVGLITYGRKLQARLNAGRGAAHLRALAEALALAQAEMVEGAHALAAETLLHAQRRRSLVVWLTDLAETPAMPDVMESALRLTPRHLVLFVVMGQPDLEKVAATRPGTSEEMYRYVAAQEMIQRRELLLRSLRHQGVLTAEVAPGRLSTSVVNSYLEIKERSLL